MITPNMYATVCYCTGGVAGFVAYVTGAEWIWIFALVMVALAGIVTIGEALRDFR